jgi:hypothetical protein
VDRAEVTGLAVLAVDREGGEAVVDGVVAGRLTDAGRATKTRIESLTDALAQAPYDGLEPPELEQLIALLEPISRRLEATGSQ